MNDTAELVEEVDEDAPEQSPCDDCSTMTDNDDLVDAGGNDVCEDCFDENYSTCEDCADRVPNDDVRMVDGGNRYVCDDCVSNNYFECACCDEYRHDEDSRTTADDETVCDRCIENNYGFCDDCDEYYHYDSDHMDQHAGCECDVPTNLVSIRNGDDVLSQNERARISLAAGFISDEGIGAISRLLRNKAPTVDSGLYSTDYERYRAEQGVAQKWHTLAYEFGDAIGAEWQTKDGNYTKRLSRFAYKTYGIKVTPDILTEVGNIGAQHSAGADYEVEITRDLNLPAEDFAHSDSCWWQSYSASRCSLKTNGGFGLRTFDDNSRWNPVTGRAWVMPLRFENGSLSPTFDARGADAYVVFNGYGQLSGYAPARIMAQMTGMTYRKVGFSNDPMYVNGDAGYLVAPEEIASQFTDGSVNLYTDEHSNLFHTEKSDAPCNHFEPCNHSEREMAHV